MLLTVGVRAIGWRPMLIVPLILPVLLCVNLQRHYNAVSWWRRFQLISIGEHAFHQTHLLHSKIQLGAAAHVWRAAHAFFSMLNTALANVLLLAAELCFWYQLANVRHEWAEMSPESQTNTTGDNSTCAEMQFESLNNTQCNNTVQPALRLVMPAGQIALPLTQNGTHLLLAHFPMSWLLPITPVVLFWLQCFVFVNYSYIRKIGDAVQKQHFNFQLFFLDFILYYTIFVTF